MLVGITKTPKDKLTTQKMLKETTQQVMNILKNVHLYAKSDLTRF